MQRTASVRQNEWERITTIGASVPGNWAIVNPDVTGAGWAANSSNPEVARAYDSGTCRPR